MSRILDWSDRATCVLFGDGAAACVVEAGGESPLAINLACKPNLTALAVPGVTGNSPFDETRDGNGAHSAGATAQACALTMKGQQVFKFGVTTICDAVNGLCEQAGIEVSAIDHFIFHQANERIIRYAAKKMGLPMERFQVIIDHVGNVSGASALIALNEALCEGKLQPGDIACMTAFGGGLTAGSCVIRI